MTAALKEKGRAKSPAVVYLETQDEEKTPCPHYIRESESGFKKNVSFVMKKMTLEELAAEYKRTSSPEAFLEILSRLSPLIKKRGRHLRDILTDDEIEQQAALGVASALLRFDPAGGNFAGFACGYIIKELSSARTSSVSDSGSARKIRRFAGERVETAMKNGVSEHAATEEAAAFYGTTRRAVEAAAAAARVSEYRDDADGETLSAAGEIEDRLSVRGALRMLDADEETVIRMRYLRDVPATLKDIGALLGFSTQHTHRIERRALEKMRAEMSLA